MILRISTRGPFGLVHRAVSGCVYPGLGRDVRSGIPKARLAIILLCKQKQYSAEHYGIAQIS
eukprot:6698964-Lingulodinium_polyedra.AAC.1